MCGLLLGEYRLHKAIGPGNSWGWTGAKGENLKERRCDACVTGIIACVRDRLQTITGCYRLCLSGDAYGGKRLTRPKRCTVVKSFKGVSTRLWAWRTRYIFLHGVFTYAFNGGTIQQCLKRLLLVPHCFTIGVDTTTDSLYSLSLQSHCTRTYFRIIMSPSSLSRELVSRWGRVIEREGPWCAKRKPMGDPASRQWTNGVDDDGGDGDGMNIGWHSNVGARGVFPSKSREKSR